MISIYLNKLSFIFFLGLLVLPALASAQGSVSLSVSPTLFEMNASPQQQWTSAVRVINTNKFPIKIYANPVNFAAAGEAGQGTMQPVFENEGDGSTLAEWIALPAEEIIVPAEQTISIPFTIDVPANAAPGGHFAAILIGTRSLTDANAPAQVQTSQVVTSLVFIRVAGDILERGAIRDFVSDQTISETTQATFSLRFENNGNVHLRPQGDIVIKNMWGKQRGLIAVNQNSQFGNVLPASIRKYNFEWTGDWSLSDIGRYTAVATLAYGDDQRQFVTSATSFWVIPWRALLLVLFILGGLLGIIIWGIKLYVRKMLLMAGVTPELKRPGISKRAVSITAPLEEGILDLRTQLRNSDTPRLVTILDLTQKYRLFIVVLAAAVVFVGLFVWYIVLALSSERGYQVSYERNGEMVPIVAESTATTSSKADYPDSTLPEISLVNRSGVAGYDELRAIALRAAGYTVIISSSEGEAVSEQTVVVYDPVVAEAAVQVQELFTDALLSSYDGVAAAGTPITIYLGTNEL